MILVKGCATCGFGSPQGFANLDRKDGAVQIGSSAVALSSSDNAGQKADSTLRCTAVIIAPDGSESARMNLLHTSGGKYVGIWNADRQPGIYRASIVASVNETPRRLPMSWRSRLWHKPSFYIIQTI